MASIYEDTNKVCHTLVTSCISIISKIQSPGCDNKSFLQGVQRATTDTQNLVQFVKGIQTKYTTEKEQLFQKTIVVKNVVVKLITDLRVYYKNAAQGQAAATPEQMAPLRAELSAALKEVGKAAQILAAAEANGLTSNDGQGFVSRPQLPGLPAMQARPSLQRSNTESNLHAPQTPTAIEQSPEAIYETAKKCLESMAEMSNALENRNRDQFTNSTKIAINYVNQLVVQKSDGVPEDARMELRQNLVSLISHSKMYFVNPDDDYIKEAFFMFKGKVETAVKAFLPEGALDVAPQTQEPAGENWDMPMEDPSSAPQPDETPVEQNNDPPPPYVENYLQTEVINDALDEEEHARFQNEEEQPPQPDVSANSSASVSTPAGEELISSVSRFTKAAYQDSTKRQSSTRPENFRIGDRSMSFSPAKPLELGSRSSEDHDHNGHDHDHNGTDPAPNPVHASNEPAEVHAPSGEEELDVQFAKTIIQLMKQNVPGDWSNFDPSKEANFEAILRGQLNGFKKMVIATQQQSEAKKKPRPVVPIPETSDKPPLISSASSSSLVRKINDTTTGGSISGKKPKKGDGKGFSKIQQKASEAIFSKKPNVPPFRLLTFSSSSSDGSLTPRVKFSKNVSDVCCTVLSEIFSMLNFFNDVGPSWTGGKTAPKPKVREEAKELEMKKKITMTSLKLLDQVKETMVTLLSASILDACGPFDKIRTRITDELKDEVKPVSLRVDESKFTKGQYLRFMKRCLLVAIFAGAENLSYLMSQYLSVVRAYKSMESHAIHFLTLCSLCKTTVANLLNDVETFYFLLEEENSKKLKLDMTRMKRKKELPNSIWKEKGEPEGLDKNDLFRAGTINALLIRLTASTFNSDLMAAFLAGYELFSSSLEVWEKLLDRYHVPKNTSEATAMNNQSPQFVKMRVANVILQWVKLDIYSIDLNVIASIEHFAEKTLKKDKFSELSGWIIKELSQVDQFSVRKIKDKEPPKSIPMFELAEYAPYECLLVDDRQTVAEQLTLIEFELYSNIKRIELTDQKWSKDKLNVFARNVIALIQRVNHVAHFCATAILMQKRIRERTNVVIRLIGVAKALYDMKNFNSLMGILVGLSLSPVSRLKHSWSKVPAKHLETFKQLENHQDPASSFKFLRDQIKAAGAVAIPYVGTYLSDLTFMDEGNPDQINVDNNKLINFPKHYLIMRTIKQLQQYQNSKFDLTSREPLYTFLTTLPSLHEKELYELSLEREPRDSLLKDIL